VRSQHTFSGGYDHACGVIDSPRYRHFHPPPRRIGRRARGPITSSTGVYRDSKKSEHGHPAQESNMRPP
jgi:hypothetical protein